MIQPSQVFLPVTFNKTFDNKGNYYVITGEVTNDTSKSIGAIYVERHDNKYILSKDELEDELNKMIQYIGREIDYDSCVNIKRHARVYLNKIFHA